MSDDPMWTNNNMAHLATWGNLKDLKQHGKAFSRAKTVTMEQLAFFNLVASPQQRRIAAKPLVVAFMALTEKVWEAKFEAGFSSKKVFDDLVSCLIDSTKTMPQLAQVVDNCYRFSSEA